MVTFLIYQSQVSIDIVTLFLNNARILEYFNSVYPFSHLCHYFHVFWFISTLYSKILFCTGGQLSYSFICLYTYGFIALIFFPQSRYHLSSFTFCLKYTHSITFMVDLLVVNSLCSFSVCLKYFNICICVCVKVKYVILREKMFSSPRTPVSKFDNSPEGGSRWLQTCLPFRRLGIGGVSKRWHLLKGKSSSHCQIYSSDLKE